MIQRKVRPIVDRGISRRSAVILACGLLICSGCPAQRTSPQTPQFPSRWMTVEVDPSTDGAPSGTKLQIQDAEAIVATVPTVTACVTERIHEARLRWEDGEAFVQVCRTVPEHLELLSESAGVEMQRGRFLSDADAAQAAAVVVLEENLASKIFGVADPIGATVEIDGQAVTVIGVVGDGHTPLVDEVGHEAYVPREYVLQGFVESDQDATELDRIYVRVESLDQVENTRSVVLNLLERRRPGREVSVR